MTDVSFKVRFKIACFPIQYPLPISPFSCPLPASLIVLPFLRDKQITPVPTVTSIPKSPGQFNS